MMEAFTTYCFDLDGTVYHGTEPVQAAVELIAKLQEMGTEPYYITNNSSATPQQVTEKLAGFGIQTAPKYVMTSALAAAHYCQENEPGKTVQVLGETGLKEALEAAGIQQVEQAADLVVMGIDRDITYEKLAQVCLAIRGGAKFIATNGDKAIPTERGLLPGSGSFVKLVEYSTGVAPIFMGKPESYMLDYIRERSGCEKQDMVLIGDNYDTDILAGIRYGIATIHVDGGVTPGEEVKKKELQPTRLVSSLLELY